MSEHVHPFKLLQESRVRGVRLFEMKWIEDRERGNLTVGEIGAGLPFVPQRFFVTYDVPEADERGKHAHRVCEQFLVCVSGRCSVIVDDGLTKEEFLLNRPYLGLLIPPMVWGTQYKHSQDSVLFVFASHAYDSADYIRNYDEFTAEVRR